MPHYEESFCLKCTYFFPQHELDSSKEMCTNNSSVFLSYLTWFWEENWTLCKEKTYLPSWYVSMSYYSFLTKPISLNTKLREDSSLKHNL
jgi:hypothetical protein